MDAKTVVITGCTRGLGLAMVREFIQAGWTVAGCGRTEPALRELADGCGEPHWFSVCDVTDPDAVGRFAGEVIRRHGPPRMLVNNAAIINAGAPLWKVPPAEFHAVLAAGVSGTYHAIRSFLPAMLPAARGVIVNFSSGWGRSTSPEVAPYCAAKWAVEGMTRALAQELPAGMAAVAFNPGVIDTDMLRTCFGSGAASCIKPAAWARSAVPFLTALGSRDNGLSLTAPGG